MTVSGFTSGAEPSPMRIRLDRRPASSGGRTPRSLSRSGGGRSRPVEGNRARRSCGPPGEDAESGEEAGADGVLVDVVIGHYTAAGPDGKRIVPASACKEGVADDRRGADGRRGAELGVDAAREAAGFCGEMPGFVWGEAKCRPYWRYRSRGPWRSDSIVCAGTKQPR